jgi:hypothetical protein
MQGDPSAINVPINLDFTKALSDFAKFQSKVESAGSDSRGNSLLDEVFGTTPEATASRNKEIAAYQRKVRETINATKRAAANAKLSGLSGVPPFSMNMGALGSASGNSQRWQANQSAANRARINSMFSGLSAPGKFGMNMSALSGSAYKSIPPMQRSRAWSNDYNSMVGREEGSKKSAYENSFQNRYLSSEIADGSYRKKAEDMVVAEKAAAKLQKTQDGLLKQGRLIQREARYGKVGGRLAHIYGENAGAFARAGSAAATGAKYAGAGAAGLTAAGFSGTVEGEKFSRELRLLSLELASAFKPLMETVTRGTRGLRRQFEQLDRAGQDRVQTVGLAAGGAYIGSRFGPIGAGVGAAVGAGAGELLARGNSRERGMNRAARENQDLNNLQGQERLDEIKRRRGELTADGGIFSVTKKRLFGKTGEADELAGQLRSFDEAKRQTELEMRARDKLSKGDPLTKPENEAIYGKQDGGPNKNRDKVMITEGTGFAAAGSTYFAIQEDLARTTATQAEMQTRILRDINANLERAGR